MTQTPDALFDVAGKGIVVAGAGGGLAGNIVRALDRRGARLVLFDNHPGRLAAVAAQVPAATALPGDITDEESLATVMAAAGEALGRVDGAVNAAGVLPIDLADDLDTRVFQECQDVNVTGAFLFSRAAARAMRATAGGDGGGDGGRIVHLASVSSFVANPGYAAYASSKGGLAQLVRVLAREWAAEGITVNAIGPALTETPLTAGYLADPGFRRRAIEVIPMGRLGTPADIVAAVLLLLAPGGAFITGQTICVDGGRTLV
ncbi:MAG: SDR family oxidoreductase [Hyphomicrobiales bacterium]|nr:SDR family oxidoreductase [Hyphomicrobiales bacterium]MCP5374192.1 SDR family oxidoreductase [Hyphomicrobiales bacterium]